MRRQLELPKSGGPAGCWEACRVLLRGAAVTLRLRVQYGQPLRPLCDDEAPQARAGGDSEVVCVQETKLEKIAQERHEEHEREHDESATDDPPKRRIRRAQVRREP